MKYTLTSIIAAQLICSVYAVEQPNTSSTQTSSAALTIGKKLQLKKGSRIAFIGGGLGSRMNIFNEFETELQRRNRDKDIFIRNLCKEGDTPAFRPHPSRGDFYAFPSGKSLVKKEYQGGGGRGHYETPDQWLTRFKIDTVIGFFGYSESFDGLQRIDGYKAELRAFIKHTKAQKYSGSAPQIAIVSPAAFEDLSSKRDLPNGTETNARLLAYSKAMAEVCKEEGVLFFDAYNTTSNDYASQAADLTSNGHNLNSAGYKKLAPALADGLFGKSAATGDYSKVMKAVAEKNRLWLLDYKIPNGVHVHGRRYKPFGDKNYPNELKKTRQMTNIRDQAIWATNNGKSFDLSAADAKTVKLSEIKTNYKSSKKNGSLEYLTGKQVEKTLKLPAGYKMELFADEKMFPNLRNPSQMAFDNKGRLWLGCMGSYPHYKIGDAKPNDKILILEDTDGDGKADKETIFVDHIHIPMGFEITETGGALVSLGNDLVLLSDTNGDSKADKKQFILSGFDDHDTHHAISAFCADPSGAIYMGEGTFLHSNVETPYGPVRGTNGGFYRFSPQKGRLERTAQYRIPNPWGIAFNEWGQNFFLHTSGTSFSWMQEGAVKSSYNVNLRAPNILKSDNVRPTSGVEFVYSSHFPDEVQGDAIICNSIGYLGAKQHKVMPDGNTAGYTTKFRHDLFKTDHGNFRPVDLEFAPDGSLYVVDWHNVLIGHMQHSIRDPHRDHVHGRVYRITYPSRPLVKPAAIAGAPISTLLDNLKLHEYRSRYRTRRELRGRDAKQVATALNKWVAQLDKSDAKYEHHVLEALWVSWGINQIDVSIVEKMLSAKDYRARAAAVRSVRYNADKLSNAVSYLTKAAADKHAHVRHEALIAATWMDKPDGLAIVAEFEKTPVDKHSKDALKYGKAHLIGSTAKETVVKVTVPKHVPKAFHKSFIEGKHLYEEGENCWSCHQKDGKGLAATGFPPLDGSKWATSDKELLSKIALHGMMGEMTVKGKKYAGAMPGFAFRKSNKEIAAMLTYVRNAWGNKCGDGFSEKEVADLLKKTEKPGGMYKPADLLKAHKLK